MSNGFPNGFPNGPPNGLRHARVAVERSTVAAFEEPNQKSAGRLEMIAQSMRRVLSVVVGLVAVAFVSVAVAGRLPEVSPDGLHLVKQDDFSAVYVKPGAKFTGYTKLALLECFVAFQQGWEQNINNQEPGQLTPQNFQQIKTRLAAEFMKVFKAKLTGG